MDELESRVCDPSRQGNRTCYDEDSQTGNLNDKLVARLTTTPYYRAWWNNGKWMLVLVCPVVMV